MSLSDTTRAGLLRRVGEQYLNNAVEQDHRAIKHIPRPMLSFKDFRCARIILFDSQSGRPCHFASSCQDGLVATDSFNLMFEINSWKTILIPD
jgi:transposase-like protein